MKSTKLLFLFLSLFLPVAIFIFLKIFGRNEFQVPILHLNGEIDAPTHCGFDYQIPYRIADSVMQDLGASAADSLYVVYFGHQLSAAMSRVSVEFKSDPIQIISGQADSKTIKPSQLRDCVLLMSSDASVALVDHKYRIRGYYDGSDRDDVDRLIVEMKIILKRY